MHALIIKCCAQKALTVAFIWKLITSLQFVCVCESVYHCQELGYNIHIIWFKLNTGMRILDIRHPLSNAISRAAGLIDVLEAN